MAFPLHSTIEQRIGACLDRGDVKQAATEALRGYGPQILAYLSGVLRDDEAAAEVFSEFSEDLWRGIGAFRRESSFRTWAYRLAWNAARQLARDPFRKRGRRLMTSEWSAIAQEVRSSAATQRQFEIQGRLAKLRTALHPDEQSLLILRVDRELSWKEVAQVMSESGTPLDEAAWRKRFERLKGRLHKMAKKEGLLALLRSTRQRRP